MKEADKTSETMTAPAERPVAANRIQLAMPIVYRPSKKRKRRRYTSGLKTVQELGRGGIRASERLSKGLDRVFQSFRTRSDNSSKKKRDGLIIDSAKNFSKGAGKALRTASRAPNDLVKRVNTKGTTRQVRNIMRTIAWPLFR